MRGILLVAVVLLAGCVSGPAPTTTPPLPAATQAPACIGTVTLPTAPPDPDGASMGQAPAYVYMRHPAYYYDGVPKDMVLIGSEGVDGTVGQLHNSNGYAGMAVYMSDNTQPFGPITLFFNVAGTLHRGDGFFFYPDGSQFFFYYGDTVVSCGPAPPPPPIEPSQTYLKADTNQNCAISFQEYSASRAALLQGTGTFSDYSIARSALLDPGSYRCGA